MVPKSLTRCAVIMAWCASLARAQRHGQGLAKASYAGSGSEASAGVLDFLIRVLNMTAAMDSFPGNSPFI